MHVDSDLSAYLDGELAPAERARVEAHLDTCDRCRSRLSELRATASLISALPTPRPSRSLVPRVVERLNWLRPIRSLSTLASGAFLFVFLVMAVARSGSGLGGGPAVPFGATGTTAAAPAAATAPTAAATAPRLAPAAAPAPAATAAVDAAVTAVRPSPATQPTAAPKAAQEAAPTARTDTASRGSPEAEAAGGPREVARTPPPPPLADPLIWLGLAVIAAIVAIGSHWRLRRT